MQRFSMWTHQEEIEEYFNDLLNDNIDFSTNLPVFHSSASDEAADGMTVH